jgi:hypothetical protein
MKREDELFFVDKGAKSVISYERFGIMFFCDGVAYEGPYVIDNVKAQSYPGGGNAHSRRGMQ